MPNHFHFLIKIKEISRNDIQNTLKPSGKTEYITPVEKAFKDFFISYAKSINKAYNRTGALFQYKFKRKLIEDQNYLTRLVPYIHLNPVRSGFCEKPQDWKFSSYNAILQTNYTNIAREEVLNWFGGITEFINFHKDYIYSNRENDILFNKL